MNDHRDVIADWADDASGFRRLKAYAVSPDDSRQPLEGSVIVVALDEERSLIMALSERIEGEGVAACSLPQGRPEAAEPCSDAATTPDIPANHSVIVMRRGGANVIDLSPERRGRGRL